MPNRKTEQRAQLKVIAAADWPEGAGVVRKIGWEKVRGKEVFRAVVDFPNGPPSLRYQTIWDRLPVEIKEREPS